MLDDESLLEPGEQPTLNRVFPQPSADQTPELDATVERAVAPTSTGGVQRVTRPLLDIEDYQPSMPLIIAGADRPPHPAHTLRIPRARRSMRQNAILIGALCCVFVAMLAAVPPIRDTAINNTPLGGIVAFTTNAHPIDPNGFFDYRVKSGDTIEGIAQRFQVTIGGIYKINAFYLGDEITIGQVIKIPNDPQFGADYQPTAPSLPTDNTPAYPGAPAGTVFGGCVFCAIAGYSTGGLCAPPSTTNLGFGLIQPDPNAHWVRGFTWYHNGVDLSTGVYGTPIVAAQDGQVIFSGWDPFGFGDAIKINHCWGLATSYGHMEQLNVSVGQFVHKGDVIGLQGSTGNSTGPHLHFMVWWHNNYVDPLTFYTELGGQS